MGKRNKKNTYRPLSAKDLTRKYVEKNKLLYRFMDGHPHRNEIKAGYCWNNEHKGWLTPKHVKEHDCIGKKCRYFQKYENGQPIPKEKKNTGDGPNQEER